MSPLIKQKSLIAPSFIEIQNSYLRIGSKYQKVFLVTQISETFLFGLFKTALNDVPNLKYFYVTRPMLESMSKALTNDLRNKEQKIRKEKDELYRQRLIKEADNLRITISDIAESSNRTLDLLLVLVITGENLQDLKDNEVMITSRLETQFGFKLFKAWGLQDVLFKSVLPFWKKSQLVKDLDYRYRIPLSSRSVSMLWSYYYEDLQDDNGILLGYTVPANGLFIHNPFLWEDNNDKARKIGITAGNMAVFGTIGSGKTTLLVKYANFLLRRYIRTIWFDPNNQNMTYVLKNNGQYVNFGAPGNIINVLELKRVGDGNEITMVDPYNMDLAKAEAIRDFKTIVKIYNPNNKDEVEKALNIVDEIILSVYKDFKIEGTSFKGFKKDDYPTINDVLNKIKKMIDNQKEHWTHDQTTLDQLVNLKLYITPLCMADGQYFNGHSKYDFNNSDTMLYGFGTKLLDNAPRNIKDAIYYLIMRQVSSILYDASRKCACIWDEFEKVALNGFTLPLVSDMVRMVRKYHSIMILGMQEPSDLNSDVLVDGIAIRNYGTAIMNNTVYKVIMKLEDKAISDLNELIHLTQYEADVISDLRTGEALFMRNKDRYNINIYANTNDLNIMKVK